MYYLQIYFRTLFLLWHSLFSYRLIRFAFRPDFYQTHEWLKLRYRVLRHYEARCMACGKSRKDKDSAGLPVVLHVDHIRPKSKWPWLCLLFRNLQILCADCNRGKSNVWADDWR